ncbi:IclR family transcriptional regulator [Micromonospora sp. KC213]|uniref:IclR family transcriptional regulator n=1 Tax=Micromonospora sp. KC213 TaxID=2530378 RepID=UPI001A9E2860|nr:IclR family transcriptional regulator [Micromonospora sp. KC213]
MEMKSVIRSLRVLEAVAQHQPVSVSELAKLFDLPKSTMQRTLITLSEAGWLRASRGDRTRWEIGARVLAVRPAAFQGSSLFAAAREPMLRLRDAVDETIHLSVPDGLECMVVVDRVDSTQTVRTFYQIGETSPLHTTAVGHAVLAHFSADDINEVVTGSLHHYGASTFTEPAQLRVALDHVRQVGYAVNRNQFRPDVCAIAAPILDRSGTPLAAVAISMPDSRFDDDRLSEWGRLVAATADEISTRHGG